MAKMLPMDLRNRVVASVREGASRRAAAAPGRRGRRPGSGKSEPFKAALIGWVETTPDITMPELAARLLSSFGVKVRPSSLSRLLCKAGWTYGKKALTAQEAERADVAKRRRRRFRWILPWLCHGRRKRSSPGCGWMGWPHPG